MPQPFQDERRFAAEYRTQLAELGFTDDGETLHGSVNWKDTQGAPHVEPIEISFDAGFPYSPPRVRPLAVTSPASLHQERSGHLCLFDRSEPAGTAAPWRSPSAFLEHVASWFEHSRANWPGDQDVDLERYLPSVGGLVLYDADVLDGKSGYLRLNRMSRRLDVVRVEWRQEPAKRAKRLLRSKEPYGWLVDVGEVTRPILSWTDAARLLGGETPALAYNITSAGLRLLLLRYSRSGNLGYLAADVQPNSGSPDGIALAAIEAADESERTRRLRMGYQATKVGDFAVTIVGLGAIGGYTADLLHRAGVGTLNMVDRQVLRPGNCIRHIAGPDYVGLAKVDATKACLARSGVDAERVTTIARSVETFTDAMAAFSNANLVVDATADNRASQLLSAAAHETHKTLLSVALIRQGGIAVVDRVGDPQRGEPLPTPPSPEAPVDIRERGCSDSVSRTPSHSVVAAAALVTRLAIDELTGVPAPTTTFEVLEPQQDAPFDQRTTFTS